MDIYLHYTEMSYGDGRFIYTTPRYHRRFIYTIRKCHTEIHMHHTEMAHGDSSKSHGEVTRGCILTARECQTEVHLHCTDMSHADSSTAYRCHTEIPLHRTEMTHGDSSTLYRDVTGYSSTSREYITLSFIHTARRWQSLQGNVLQNTIRQLTSRIYTRHQLTSQTHVKLTTHAHHIEICHADVIARTKIGPDVNHQCTCT